MFPGGGKAHSLQGFSFLCKVRAGQEGVSWVGSEGGVQAPLLYYKQRYVRWMLALEDESFFWGALGWAEQGIQAGAGVWALCKIQDCT